MRTRLLSFFLIVGLYSAPVLADVNTLGNGFSCEGSSILRNGIETTYSKAKSNIQKTITKLKNKLKSAAPKKRAAIKKKIKEASTTKKNITACFNGSLSPNQVDPIFSQLAGGGGTYNGTYNGVVGGFIPISGPMTLQFILDGTNFSALLTLGGNLNSALNGQPLSFGATNVGGIGFPAQIFIADTFLGNVTLSITQSGQIAISNDNPAKGINFQGNLSGSSISASLTGVYSGISFVGSCSLSK